MINLFKNKYRIVTDNYCGYEVQIKRWWFPIWLQVRINSFSDIESAEKFARQGTVVKYID